MSIKPIFRWFDLWIGVFIDTKKRIVYFFPVPMFGFMIVLPKPEIELPPMEQVIAEVEAEKERQRIARLYERRLSPHCMYKGKLSIAQK